MNALDLPFPKLLITFLLNFFTLLMLMNSLVRSTKYALSKFIGNIRFMIVKHVLKFFFNKKRDAVVKGLRDATNVLMGQVIPAS